MDISQPGFRYKIASRDIACENFDGEYVILNLHSGQYYAVSPGATAFLDGVLAGLDPAEMIRHMADERGAEASAFFGDLLARGIFAKDSSAMAEPVGPEWIAKAAYSTGPLVIEVFNDLADLLVSDPIHDTETERGWPVVRDGP